jgi:CRP/FNR family transcriptional regulator, cyclic AMP receptor protein
MQSPFHLEVVDNCKECSMREHYLFCNLPAAALQGLNEIKTTATYPKGTMLFMEGQDSRGVYILCHGKAKLSTSSSEGKTVILRIAEPGEVLGLSAAMSGRPYELTAELLEPTQANFIPRTEFLRFLGKHGEAAVRVAQHLSNNYHAACTEIRSLGLSQSASEKLARLLLDWSEQHGEADSSKPVRVQVTLTHEEIAQLIGASRETVTRMFSDFKKKKLIEVKGATLVIRDKTALTKMVHS